MMCHSSIYTPNRKRKQNRKQSIDSTLWNASSFDSFLFPFSLHTKRTHWMSKRLKHLKANWSICSLTVWFSFDLAEYVLILFYASENKIYFIFLINRLPWSWSILVLCSVFCYFSGNISCYRFFTVSFIFYTNTFISIYPTPDKIQSFDFLCLWFHFFFLIELCSFHLIFGHHVELYQVYHANNWIFAIKQMTLQWQH